MQNEVRRGVAGRTPEEIARAFHDAYEALAPHFSYDTRPESAKPWDEIPERNRDLMIATVRAVLFEPIGVYPGPGPARAASPSSDTRERRCRLCGKDVCEHGWGRCGCGVAVGPLEWGDHVGCRSPSSDTEGR